MPRIMSDASPWVGGGRLYAVPGRRESASGAFTSARVARQVAAGERAAGACQVGGDRVRERAAIEGVKPVLRESPERPSEALVHEPVARRGDGAAGQELLRESRHGFEVGALVPGIGVLARGDRDAVLGVVDGIGQQAFEGARAAPAPADREGRLPSRTPCPARCWRQGDRATGSHRIPAPGTTRGWPRPPPRRTRRSRRAPRPERGRSRTHRPRWRSCAGRRRRWRRRRRPSPRWRCLRRAAPRARTGPRDDGGRRPCPWWRLRW